MKPENHPEHNISKVASDPARPGADGRTVARRRFLQMGAGGTAAVVVTVTHKRAFAGVKKGLIASRCTSLRGVPDLKHSTGKNPLQTSAMGTPKGAICRPQVNDSNPLGSMSTTQTAKFTDQSGTRFIVVDGKQLDKGFGDINTTLNKAYNYRLYQEGYCPIVLKDGAYQFDLTKAYFDKGVQKMCQRP